LALVIDPAGSLATLEVAITPAMECGAWNAALCQRQPR
tara:strand:+ start:2370 stop:2483 length:114 start_codon:yes stop_codon:yes gene_type:complete